MYLVLSSCVLCHSFLESDFTAVSIYLKIGWGRVIADDSVPDDSKAIITVIVSSSHLCDTRSCLLIL